MLDWAVGLIITLLCKIPQSLVAFVNLKKDCFKPEG